MKTGYGAARGSCLGSGSHPLQLNESKSEVLRAFFGKKSKTPNDLRTISEGSPKKQR